MALVFVLTKPYFLRTLQGGWDNVVVDSLTCQGWTDGGDAGEGEDDSESQVSQTSMNNRKSRQDYAGISFLKMPPSEGTGVGWCGKPCHASHKRITHIKVLYWIFSLCHPLLYNLCTSFTTPYLIIFVLYHFCVRAWFCMHLAQHEHSRFSDCHDSENEWNPVKKAPAWNLGPRDGVYLVAANPTRSRLGLFWCVKHAFH